MNEKLNKLSMVNEKDNSQFTTHNSQFKKTEVGVIPEDWKVVEFGDICLLSKTRMNPIISDEYKCIELEHISQQTGRLLGHTNSKYLKSQKTKFNKGDVLFGKLRPYLRKFLFANFEGVCTTEIWVLKSNNDFNNKWLFYLVQSKWIDEKANLSEGTKMPRADWETVSSTKIPLPPTRTEQTAIATALSDMDALIEKLEQLIAKKRNIKQGAMQELLKPKEGWEVVGFKTLITSTQLGSNYPNNEIDNGIPLIKMGNLGRGSISLKKLEFITTDTVPLEKDILKHGDVLFNTRNTLELVGKVAIWRNELSKAYFNSNIMRFKFDPKKIESSFYMNYMLNSKQLITQLKNIATGTTSVAAIYTRDLLKIQIPLPPTKLEQTTIANTLSDMDSEIEKSETQLSKYKMIKTGMMQELLTGKKRLI